MDLAKYGGFSITNKNLKTVTFYKHKRLCLNLKNLFIVDIALGNFSIDPLTQ